MVLSLAVTLLLLAAAGVTARLLANEMNEVFDKALRETGQRILQLAALDVLSREEEGIIQQVTALNAQPENFSYLVRNNRGQRLLTSHRADPALIPVFVADGSDQTPYFRLYQALAVQGTIILTIAEPLARRQSVARAVAFGLGLPLLAMIPLTILASATGLGFGLSPIGQMRDQLALRDANHLSPLPTDGLPAELQPVAMTENQLFQWLGLAFDAECAFSSNAAHKLRTPLAGAIAQG